MPNTSRRRRRCIFKLSSMGIPGKRALPNGSGVLLSEDDRPLPVRLGAKMKYLPGLLMHMAPATQGIVSGMSGDGTFA